jgi:hypothetical protein
MTGEEYKYEAPHYKTLHPSDSLLQPHIPLSIRSPTHSGQTSFARRYNYKARIRTVPWLSLRSPTAESRVCAQVSPCGISGGQSSSGANFFLQFLLFPVTIVPPWLPMLIYHLGGRT